MAKPGFLLRRAVPPLLNILSVASKTRPSGSAGRRGRAAGYEEDLSGPRSFLIRCPMSNSSQLCRILRQSVSRSAIFPSRRACLASIRLGNGMFDHRMSPEANQISRDGSHWLTFRQSHPWCRSGHLGDDRGVCLPRPKCPSPGLQVILPFLASSQPPGFDV